MTPTKNSKSATLMRKVKKTKKVTSLMGKKDFLMLILGMQMMKKSLKRKVTVVSSPQAMNYLSKKEIVNHSVLRSRKRH